MGLLDAESGTRGNQELVVQIQLPPNLGRDELAMLQALDAATEWDPRGAWWSED